MAKVCPCKDCVAPKRYPGCHSVCPEYKEWDAEHQKELAVIRAAKQEQSYCFLTSAQSRRIQKRQERRKKYGSNTIK